MMPKPDREAAKTILGGFALGIATAVILAVLAVTKQFHILKLIGLGFLGVMVAPWLWARYVQYLNFVTEVFRRDDDE